MIKKAIIYNLFSQNSHTTLYFTSYSPCEALIVNNITSFQLINASI